MSRLKLEAIAYSVALYLIVVVAIMFGIIYEPSTPKAKTYVAKNSEIIEVSLGKPLARKSYKQSRKKKSAKSKKNKKQIKPKEKKRKKIPKKVRNIAGKKPVKKIVKKSKKAKAKVIKKRAKIDASSLFSKLPSNIKADSPVQKAQPKGNAGKSLKKSDRAKGIVNKYFAKVQSTLRGWPAQSNFVGETIKVELTIYNNGMFDYKILRRSLNPEFNNALKEYLEQLKKFGFGPHNNPTPYHIIVEFVAKG